ncbi:MAG: putative hydrolase [Candidatus Saccharibacteria bacterium]|nr:putative hydrolase [Candidatus Saccharibacteria bacterium]
MNSAPFKGVNLGGWLVLEKWMTPSLFEGRDAKNEYELVQSKGGKAVLEQHHTTFMTEADFMWLNDHNINAVRIPIGYWIFGDESPYIGAIEKLDWAIMMGEKYNIKVLIDLHGAPGAQNAAGHSGSGRPDIPRWLDDPDKQERTIRVLERLAERYFDRPIVWGIELVNEPLADKFGFRLIRFYRRAYKRLLRVARPGLYIVFSDGFKPLLLTGALWKRNKLPVAMDCHLYQCFGEHDRTLTVDEHLVRATQRRWLIRFLQLWQPVIIGEWSGVLPWSLQKNMSQSDRERMRNQFITRQRMAYADAVGWYYWNYKTENKSGWNFRSIAETDPEVLQ